MHKLRDTVGHLYSGDTWLVPEGVPCLEVPIEEKRFPGCERSTCTQVSMVKKMRLSFSPSWGF